MPRDKSRNRFQKGVFVTLVLMLVIVGSNFAIGLSSSSQPQTSPAVKSPSFLEHVLLKDNSQNIVFSGLLVDGLNQNPIANATINIVDSRNLTVYGQATTNAGGGFASNFPLNVAKLSLKAEFLGDSQYQGCVSDTVNVIVSLGPTPTQTVPELEYWTFPLLAIIMVTVAGLLVYFKKCERY
jgi:hypothetical protein